MIDESAQKFGLPNSLLVPIAAADIEAIETYVGAIQARVVGRDGRINAISVKPSHWPPIKESDIDLWKQKQANEFEQRLHPKLQIWVYVDFAGYRKAYLNFETPEIPPGYFLDHIQNREAIRLKNYSHPYLRLCPVSRRVNTSGGTNWGGEGMEKDFIRNMPTYSEEVQKAFLEATKCRIVYADPMDLTKMLDIPPGTTNLEGVGKTQGLFYPPT